MDIAAIQFPYMISIGKIDPAKTVADFIYKSSLKNERKFLKAFLLNRLHQLFLELFQNNIQCDQGNFSMECYAMDNKIIQLLILGIVETGEYTIEGVALYTDIPFDVIYDAACGINNKLSITPWMRIVDLYIQVKPDIAQLLVDRLIKFKERHHAAFSLLLKK